jgi:aspartate aminotransferase-like enzyme
MIKMTINETVNCMTKITMKVEDKEVDVAVFQANVGALAVNLNVTILNKEVIEASDENKKQYVEDYNNFLKYINSKCSLDLTVTETTAQ